MIARGLHRRVAGGSGRRAGGERAASPFCTVGCARDVYVSGGKVIQIEDDDNSPISRGRLCPKGSAGEQLVTSPERITTVLHRKPYATEWEELDRETAMDLVAERVLESRAQFWEDTDSTGGTPPRSPRRCSCAGCPRRRAERQLKPRRLCCGIALRCEDGP